MIKHLLIAHLIFVCAVFVVWGASIFVAWDVNVWPPMGEWDNIWRFILSLLYIYVWVIPTIYKYS